MAQSPDGKTIATAAGDETLRFWKIFDIQAKDKYKSSVSPSTPRMFNNKGMLLR